LRKVFSSHKAFLYENKEFFKYADFQRKVLWIIGLSETKYFNSQYSQCKETPKATQQTTKH